MRKREGEMWEEIRERDGEEIRESGRGKG